jgi:hypothetical protein
VLTPPQLPHRFVPTPSAGRRARGPRSAGPCLGHRRSARAAGRKTRARALCATLRPVVVRLHHAVAPFAYPRCVRDISAFRMKIVKNDDRRRVLPEALTISPP